MNDEKKKNLLFQFPLEELILITLSFSSDKLNDKFTYSWIWITIYLYLHSFSFVFFYSSTTDFKKRVERIR